MPELDIPDAPEALTARWLTAALRAGGAIERASVVSADVALIAVDRGIGGQVARVRLQYDREEAGAPATLIAKLPSAIELTRGGGRFLRLPEREVRFYAELRDAVPLASPQCYYAAVDVDGDAFVLLLEDLEAFPAGDDVAGCSVEQAETVARALASLHATWWQNPGLARLDWMPAINERATTWQRLYTTAWREHRDAAADLMPDAMLPLAERLTSSAAVAIDRLAASPATLLHGDMRLDNLFFPADADAPPLIAVDWSNATRGPGPYDLAYFCCMAFTPERRREHEDRLLHLYHEALLERGVTGYRFDACFDDYRLSFLEPFMRMFFLLVRGHAEKGTDRPQRVLAKFVRHAAQAALDLDAGADRGLREPPGRAGR